MMFKERKHINIFVKDGVITRRNKGFKYFEFNLLYMNNITLDKLGTFQYNAKCRPKWYFLTFN